MRFQSLDLNMGDNYVDKHRQRRTIFMMRLGDGLESQVVRKNPVSSISVGNLLNSRVI